MQIPYTWDIKEKLQKIKEEVQKEDGEMRIDLEWTNGGAIKVKGVSLYFTIRSDSMIEIKIIDKPFLVTESFIEKKIAEYLSNFL